jgi:F-type H+-transporting ATPase subunit b
MTHQALLPVECAHRAQSHADRVCKAARQRLVVVWAALLLATGPLALAAAAQPEQQPPGETHAAAGEGEHADAVHGESLLAFLSRVANFAILIGGLYYLLRSPVGRYLDARGQQIRTDLVQAAETRAEAAARLAHIEERMKALPGELDALGARGREEIAAEQVRMKQAAEGERHRLIEQTRREIDRQLQIARRELTEHAADLAVGVARARLSRELTPADQLRLVDRYVTEVGGRRE